MEPTKSPIRFKKNNEKSGKSGKKSQIINKFLYVGKTKLVQEA